MDRKPFEGVWNVVKFNWHFYLIVLGAILAVFIVSQWLEPIYQNICTILVVMMLLPVIISLVLTHWIYDRTTLYQLDWLKNYASDIVIANFNAGFDETTLSIRRKKPKAKVIALDFYDEAKHTEISIKRARKAYPEVPGTLSVKTEEVPIKTNSVDLVIGFLSMHEIRDREERIAFFKNLKKVLTENGEIVIIEHLRDLPNFIAYTIGFIHFHSKATWLDTFKESGLKLKKEEKINPFMSKFILSHGVTT